MVEWEKINTSNEESDRIIESNTHRLKIKLKDSDKEEFYKTIEAYRIKEYDEMYWETTNHEGVDIPYKTPFLGQNEQLVVSYDDPNYNAVTVITNHRVFYYDFDRHVIDGYLFWDSECDVSVINSHNISQSVSSGSFVGVGSSGMRVGSGGGISQGMSKTVGDVLFTKNGKTHVRINCISGPSGIRQHVKSIIRSYR